MYVHISSLFLFLFFGSCFCAGVQFVIESMTVTPGLCSDKYFMYINSEIFGADIQRSYGMPYQIWSWADHCGDCARCSNPITDWNTFGSVDWLTKAHCTGPNPTGCTDWMNHGKNDAYSPFAKYTNTNTMTVFGDDHLLWLINTLVMEQTPNKLSYAFVMANCSTVVNENIIPFDEAFYWYNGHNSGVSIAGHYKCLQPTTTTSQTTSTSSSTLTSTIGSSSTETTSSSTSTETTSEPPNSNDKSNIGLKVGLVVFGLTTCILSVLTGYLIHRLRIKERKVATSVTYYDTQAMNSSLPNTRMAPALPDVIIQDLTKNHEFLILACDGIWDVLSNQEAIDFCRDRIASGLEPEIICEELLTRCLAPDCQMGGLGCDNMTAILVVFLHGDTYEAANARCAQPRPPSPEADYSTAMSGAEQTPAQGADNNTGDFSTPPSTPIAKNSSQTRPADPQSGVTPPLEIPIGVQPPAAKATADDVISDGEYASAAAAEDDSPPQQVPDLHRMSGAPGADPAAHADDDSPPMNFQADTPVSGDRTTSSIAPSKSSASDSSSDSRSQAATTTEKASSIPDNAGDAAQLHAGSKRKNN